MFERVTNPKSVHQKETEQAAQHQNEFTSNPKTAHHMNCMTTKQAVHGVAESSSQSGVSCRRCRYDTLPQPVCLQVSHADDVPPKNVLQLNHA